MNLSRNYRKLWLLLIAVMVLTTACGSTDSEPVNEPEAPDIPVVVFADAGWDSLRLHNSIAQFVFENGFGIATDVLPGSSVNLLEGMVVGDVHVEMEMWQDNMPAFQQYVEEGKVLDLGTNFDDNAQGLYVPRYMIEGDPERGIDPMAPELKHIEDLAMYADLFPDPEDPGRAMILNGPPGWEVTTITEHKITNIGLTDYYNVVGSGSSASLMAALSAAYEKGEPWVGYLWEPTWITGKLDLVLLEDNPFDEALWSEEGGYGCEFKSIDVVIAADPNLEVVYPEATAFLRNYKTSSALTAQALAYVQDSESTIDEAAVWFLIENEELWKGWLPEENYQKVMDALQ